MLALSGVFEAVWATALGKSEGFSRPVPTAVFGIGAGLTVGYAMATGAEPASAAKVALLLGIVAASWDPAGGHDRRRMGDSNPRGFYPNTISNRAP